MEIGSEFCIENINQSIQSKKNVPEWLNRYGTIHLTSSGRGAINLALKNISPLWKKVLLPSYICDSVIIPFLDNNYEIEFYNLNKDLSVVASGIKLDNIGVFLYMDYFGFETNIPDKNLLRIMKEKNVIIIEDITHSLFRGKNLISYVDYYVGSLRKWFGIYSGGVIASKNVLRYLPRTQQVDLVTVRKKGMRMKVEYINGKSTISKDGFLSLLNKGEAILDFDSKSYNIDEESEHLIMSLNTDNLKNKRVINYQYLRNNMVESNLIEFLTGQATKQDTPFFMPIYVKGNRRDSLRSFLISREIYCPIHWPLSQLRKQNTSGTVSNIYNSILSIPCDQRYTIEDMSRIVQEISNWNSKEVH